MRNAVLHHTSIQNPCKGHRLVCRQELPLTTFELVVNMNSSSDCKPFAALLAPTAHPLVAESRIG